VTQSELNFTKSLFAESEVARKELERQLAEIVATVAQLHERVAVLVAITHEQAATIARRDATIDEMTSEWAEQNTTIERLRAVLTRYGRHTSKCEFWSSERTMALRVCDCGLSGLVEQPS
jgi:septal ring factor EnvC (AmiA/AmiB activator)